LVDGSENSVDLPLRVLHEEISLCRVCEPSVTGFEKPPRLDRGEVGKIMIIGQGPGSAELKGTRAFAGQSGRTLNNWLIACGADSANPRAAIYFTSVIKCVGPEKNFGLMTNNCAQFLQRQILEIHPALIITLGKKSYEALRIFDDDYGNALCRPLNTEELVLVTSFGFHYSLLHWPHPSGLNRWLNLAENKERLNRCLWLFSSSS
jgi:uracil-DNA glycosylase